MVVRLWKKKKKEEKGFGRMMDAHDVKVTDKMFTYPSLKAECSFLCNETHHQALLF